jgi:hypothetical protein
VDLLHPFRRPEKHFDLRDLFPTAGGRRRGGSRAFDVVLLVLVLVFLGGWTWGIAVAAETGIPIASAASAERLTANPFDRESAPEAAYLMDALVRQFSDIEDLRGSSGNVDVTLIQPGAPLALALPDSLPKDVVPELRPVRDGKVDLQAPGVRADSAAPAPQEAGVWALTLRSPTTVVDVPGVRVLVEVPASRRVAGDIGEYHVGEWPFEHGRKPPKDIYQTPSGFVQVTQENVSMPVSQHFVLGDFVTKGQVDTWPKYVVMSPRLLDKLELTVQELAREGHPVKDVGVISGFRTPWYNAHGGNTEGRASLSRHMYGDAMDIYIDNDGDRGMDDLNGDGRVDVKDARVLANAAQQVEREHPNLVGGIGVYAPTGAHRGFVHIDTRGYRARWGPWG